MELSGGQRAILDRFEMKVDMQPVPDARDFRIALSKEDMTRLQGEVDNRLKAAEERGGRSPFGPLDLPGAYHELCLALAQATVVLAAGLVLVRWCRRARIRRRQRRHCP